MQANQPAGFRIRAVSPSAFAPRATPGATIPGTGEDLLTDLATTAWLAVLPPTPGSPGLPYYAQPAQAPLFATAGGGTMLGFQPIVAATLPSYASGDPAPPLTFPVGAYAGIANTDTAAARALERAALAPLRGRLIAEGRAATSAPVRAAASTVAEVVTPRGLAMKLDGDRITGIRIASLPGSPLGLEDIGADFQAALLAAEVFVVVSNTTVFLNQATCVAPFAIDLDGWRFDLDPSLWRTGEAPTLAIWKYANRTLADLAADTAVWSWPAVAADDTGDLAPTWEALNRILAEARLADDGPLAAFYREVVANPGWNGILFLNAPIDPGGFPGSLRFVTAGLHPADLFAHHVGVSVTSVGGSTTSSVFGLIDHADPVDLVPDQTVPYAFKTTRLTACFANAHLAALGVEVELALNWLFGAPLVKRDARRGNNLLITGTLQAAGGGPSYTFSVEGENRFGALNAAVSEVEITSVRIETLSDPGGTHASASFALGGKLRFVAMPGFDLFSYGPAPAATAGGTPFDGWLSFNQLVLVMDFPIADPHSQIWTVNETGIGFDLAASKPRPDGLAAGFPVTPVGLVVSQNLALPGAAPSGLSPEDMGFPSISAPLTQTPMEPPWYGLVMSLDLGGLGALMGGAGLTAELLAAWRLGADSLDPPVYLGLKLPSTPTIGGSFPLQGVLKLGFRGMVFGTYQRNGAPAYLLHLSRFSLTALGLTVPPGNLDVTLFAGADGRSTGPLGWLASYVEPASGGGGRARRRRLGRLRGEE
ncbi:MAG: hypothetical protein HQL40_19660 [Alphaproteobacteria bacterium]|nr:hypothetical protein [Alphaproteobacteria bacterium]